MKIDELIDMLTESKSRGHSEVVVLGRVESKLEPTLGPAYGTASMEGWLKDDGTVVLAVD